jgi:hypothetical protein
VRTVIRRAIPAETPFLNELTWRSVLSWGYEPEFLSWEPETIRVTSEFIVNAQVFVLEDTGRIDWLLWPARRAARVGAGQAVRRTGLDRNRLRQTSLAARRSNGAK